MEVHKRYRVMQFAGNITRALEKRSNILRYFTKQYEGAFVTKGDYNGPAVPSVFFERTMDIGPADIEDISQRVGCPEALDYTCMLGDDFPIALSHKISKGVKINKCNAKQYDTKLDKQLQQAMVMVSNATASKLDDAHLHTIYNTAPYLQTTTVNKDNILGLVKSLGLVMEEDKKQTKNELPFKIIMPSYYQTYLETAFLEHEKINLKFEDLREGVSVSRVSGYDIELWSNISFMMAATPDAWAIVSACWDQQAVRAFYEQKDKNTYIDQEMFTGGGYKWQWKHNITDEAVIKNIVVLKETTPATGEAPTVMQPSKVNDGLRVVQKTTASTLETVRNDANQDYVRSVNLGYTQEDKDKLGEIYDPLEGTPLKGAKDIEKPQTQEVTPEVTQDETQDENVSELDNMSKPELIEYAEKNGIDIAKAKTKEEILEILNA